jgi:hypothetical protein
VVISNNHNLTQNGRLLYCVQSKYNAIWPVCLGVE